MSTIPEPVFLTDQELRELTRKNCGAGRGDYACHRIGGHGGRHIDHAARFAWEDYPLERVVAVFGEYGPGPAYTVNIYRHDQVSWQGRHEDGLTEWVESHGFARSPSEDHGNFKLWRKSDSGVALVVAVSA